MTSKFFLCFIFLTSLVACSSTMQKTPAYNAPSDDATIKLAEAANSVSNAMVEMTKTEKVLTPRHLDNTLNIPNIAGLQPNVSVDWSGPIAELTHKVAKVAHYKFRTLGQEPAIPILVGVRSREKGLSLAEILRNLDYQAANKATIVVYPEQKTIELRYANPYA